MIAVSRQVICDKGRGERVVGVHVVGDSAAETVQGFAVALRCGATKVTAATPSPDARRRSGRSIEATPPTQSWG